MVPRVVEALLGTQFRGREFDKYPIVRCLTSVALN